MPKRSAGLLLYRRDAGALQVLLVHPGGPFWAKRDVGAWSIPKGEYEAADDPLAAARREFLEELGCEAPTDATIDLGEAAQPSRKLVRAYAVPGDLDVTAIRSNVFEMEWPPGSGRRQSFPEIDRAAWFALSEASEKILPGQRVFLDRLTKDTRQP